MQENLMLRTEPFSTTDSIEPFRVLERGSAASFFEPVVSVHQKGVVGLEALSRVVDPESRGMFGLQELFRDMQEEDFYLKLGLDSLCRWNGLKSFTPFQAQKPRLLLFLDIEPSVLEENIIASGHFLRQVEESGLEPRQVALQLPLSGKMDSRLVGKFIQFHREHGFLIGLKNANAGAERMSRFFSFNPDLVKLEDGLVRGLARVPEKRAAFRDVAKLAHSLGVVVVAGNLDNEEDSLASLEEGADLLQGKYFTKHYPKGAFFTLDRKARMMFLSARFRRGLRHRALRDRERMGRCERIGESILSSLQGSPAADLELALPVLSRQYPALECLYRLNPEGFQVGKIACNEYHIPERKRFLFEPSAPGSDHSLREHYYALSSNMGPIVTEPHLSMNSGHLCATAAKCLDGPDGDFQILCADLNLSKV